MGLQAHDGAKTHKIYISGRVLIVRMKSTLVADIMTREPFTIGVDTSLLECAKIMVRKKVGSLPIVDKKQLVGFISQSDVLWAFVKNPRADPAKIKARDLSPKKIATLRPDASIEEAIRRMNKLRFDKFPVLKGKELLGIITVKDILSFHPEIYPELEELSEIRDEQEKLKRIKMTRDLAVTEDGICEECGKRDALYRIHGMLVCDSCRSSI